MVKRSISSIVLAVIGCTLLLSACNRAKVPTEIQGIWYTKAPGYTDRFLKLDPGYMVLGVGEEKVEPRTVTKVEIVPAGNRKLYTLTTTERGENPIQLAFYFDPAEGGSIQFKNQQELIWTRNAPEVK